MEQIECLPYKDTGYFSQLILDYLDQKEEVKSFYNRFPNIESFKAQIIEKSSFSETTRQVLVESLKGQYANLSDEKVSRDAAMENISSLGQSTTFTVVTGHQLNLFTGPLYFVYKIVSTINLAKLLSDKYPDYNFVPVYWMATEDHDFEEINFVNIKDEKVRWTHNEKGPVGRFNTEGIEDAIEKLASLMGPGTNAAEFIQLLKTAYGQNLTLADATRVLVHNLFGSEGLVVVDGDDKKLKQLAIPFFRSELHANLALESVSKTSEKLNKNYFQQVNPREINLFYIKDGLRERIEKSGDTWLVLNTDIRFTKENLEEELLNFPDRFSPNVILRPLYQEAVLPNLAYIGGGGEIAYWLQLKEMFKNFKVPFPMLILRNSVLWYTSKQHRKLDKLGLSVQDLFQPLNKIKSDLIKRESDLDLSLSKYHQQLEAIFDDLERVALLTDKSMLGAVNAQQQKQLNGLANLRKKLLKAESRSHNDILDRAEKIYFELFPTNSLQERYSTLAVPYSEYGDDFIVKLLESINPLDFCFSLVEYHD